METKDLFVTPIFLVIIYGVAFMIRPAVSTKENARYFIPGLTLKLIGALAVGIIYQFYYGGGDTFTYFHLGSRYIYEAFKDSPIIALKLIFAGKEYVGDTFQYASKIYTYGDLSSYFVVRMAGAFDILTFHTYSATAVLFATMSFSGLWALFHVLYLMYPKQHLGMALAVLFVPSVFFWGSGILKDTITLGALGWATYCIYYIFIARRKVIFSSILLLVSLYTIFTIKIYIMLCFLPAAILWVFYFRFGQLKNVVVKIMVAPLTIVLGIILGYYSIIKIGENNPRYNIEEITETAKVTAEWIHYVSQRDGGSAYSLGDFDYSPAGMVRKFIPAVWVTLYRPHLWEANSIVMLLSALEAFALLLFSIYVLYKVGLISSFRHIGSNPFLIFCFVFSIFFAFAVGLTTYNFGSLVRYKIPFYPFFVSALFILLSYSKRERKRALLEATE